LGKRTLHTAGRQVQPARALELKDVLAKANSIVHDFLVKFHNEGRPDMARSPHLHAESHEVQRRT